MSKSGYVLVLVVLTTGVAFAGCIVEYDGNEAGAGASTGGASATGGSTAKGGGTSTGASSGGCSLGHPGAERAPAAFAASLALALSLWRRRRR